MAPDLAPEYSKGSDQAEAGYPLNPISCIEGSEEWKDWVEGYWKYIQQAEEDGVKSPEISNAKMSFEKFSREHDVSFLKD